MCRRQNWLASFSMVLKGLAQKCIAFLGRFESVTCTEWLGEF